MKKLWLALLFFTGGVAHEVRFPVGCQCIAARQSSGPARRKSA
jgi:hypothetical protein